MFINCIVYIFVLFVVSRQILLL